MLDFVIPLLFAVFGAFFIILSRSKRNYVKLIENSSVEFANKVNNGLKIGGYLLLACSFLYLVFDIITNK